MKIWKYTNIQLEYTLVYVWIITFDRSKFDDEL